MAISLQPNIWHVKNSEGNYLSSAILSTTLPQEADAILQRVRSALNAEEVDATTFKNGFSDDLDSLVSDARGTLDQMLEEQEQLISDIRSTAQAKTDAQSAAAAAEQSATNAAGSASAAAGSASNAADDAEAAARSASAASTSETNAGNSANAAAGSATAASESASDAAGSAQEAQDILDSIPNDYSDLSDDVDQLKIDITKKANAAELKSATPGDIVTFESGAEGLGIAKLVVNIEPVQEGSGDPSPDNICPIEGWTGCEVVKASRNMYDTLTFTDNFYIDGNGSMVSSQYFKISDYIDVSEGEQIVFTLHNNRSAECRLRLHGYTKEKVWVAQIDVVALGYNEEKTFAITIPSGISCVRWSYNKPAYANKLFAARGQILPLTFTDPTTGDPMTLYGGTVTINGDGSADLVSTMGNIASYAGETLPGAWLSSMDVYAEGATPTTGAQVVYELAMPETYHFDSVGQLTTFLGTNNIWADTGSITELTYYSDTQSTLNDIRSLITSIESTSAASKNYSIGDVLLYNDKLYVATSVITTGATLTPGTNIVETNVIARLVDLETRLKSGTIENADLHLGLYVDNDGDISQVDD